MALWRIMPRRAIPRAGELLPWMTVFGVRSIPGAVEEQEVERCYFLRFFSTFLHDCRGGNYPSSSLPSRAHLPHRSRWWRGANWLNVAANFSELLIMNSGWSVALIRWGFLLRFIGAGGGWRDGRGHSIFSGIHLRLLFRGSCHLQVFTLHFI